MNNNLNSQLPKIDQKTKALVSLLLGIILSIYWGGWFIGFIKLPELRDVMINSLGGLVGSTLGVIFGVKGLKSSKRNFAIIGIVLCALVLLFSAYMFVGWLIAGGPFYL